MESKNENAKVPLISKIAYGFGDVGCNFSWMFVSNFLMIFYTDVFGISMAAVSALMLFSRFWDAINDPIVGGLTDKTKTKWGRYRPWLLIAAPITAVLLIMTFWAHPDWSDRSKVIYMVITYCLLVLGYTCVNIPYGTLCGAMTQDIDERAKINTSRSVSAMVAIGIINIITVPLIGKLGSQSAKIRIPTGSNHIRMYFCSLSFLLFCKNKRAGDYAGKRKNIHKSAVKSGDAEPPIYSGINRTGVIRIYTLWKKCRCFILFHLCRGKCILLYYIFHVHYHSIHYRCCMFPAGIPKIE